MADLLEFQVAAVDRIVCRLIDNSGSRRFLLADEVGLGKTLVAKGVIDELRSRTTSSGFTIVYICSNSEIADQNRDKLCDEKECAVPGRLTLLALQSQQIGRRRDNGLVQVFAFTPGTSLQVEHGTGIARERRLLLYLLLRVWRKRINRPKWREFFRCSVDTGRWKRETAFRNLKGEFFRSIAGDLQHQLKQQWESQTVQLVNPTTGEKQSEARRLSECIDQCVDEFAQGHRFSHKNRNRVIGELRRGLARVSLEFLKPNVTILDEFQRFSDIMQQSRDERSIVGRLFATGSGAILILSATPYRMYTLAHENEDHHQDFLRTLAFLRNEPVDGPGVRDIQSDLFAFRDRLVEGEWVSADDAELIALRGRIEGRLKEVMCRTERNWYLEDAAKGVSEVTSAGVLPQKPELIEYVQLRHFLLGHNIGDWNITDFWKSSPSVLSFMDSHYGLTSRIRRERLSLPETVLRPSDELPELASDNAKFRLLFDKVFGESKPKEVAGSWKFLWVRPTYTYYKDTFYMDCEPAKFLIFSHWRFVPKAVSVLTSHEAAKRIGRPRRRLQSTPLHFGMKLAFYPFDVCYPSLALADCVNQLQCSSSSADLPSEKQMFVAARASIKTLLTSAGIEFGDTRTAPLWKIMARVEARSQFAAQVRNGLERAQRWKLEETSEYLPKHAKQYLAWMNDTEPLSISPMWLDRLTGIALYSPAVSLLRSFQSVFPQSADEVLESVLRFCIGPLRHYFNKRMVQIIIRRHGAGGSYTEKVLSYCQKAHFQAVLDEYAYLVRNVLQQGDTGKFLAHIARAMGMWSGSPGVNERTRSGHISRRPKPQPAHFALAFGDDVSSETTEADGKGRKSAVREAFNSPFWPFVLATTSVGQEGLDFHLYCRDIVHWNLPSNPVDLEQREGRINRFDGLSIRRNIASDFPLEKVRPHKDEERPNLWSSIFRRLAGASQGNGRFKHGLFPHWIYQSQVRDETAPHPDQSIIRRHLLFYAGSRDCQRYTDLKNSLALYRLVFGQPRQQDILEQVRAQQHTHNPHELNCALSKYMINLSPFGTEHAIRRANTEAERLLRAPEALFELLGDVPDQMTRIPEPILREIQSKVDDLIMVAGGNRIPSDEDSRRLALRAILYLLDPYDAVHDRHGIVGYIDDTAVIHNTHAEIFGAGGR